MNSADFEPQRPNSPETLTLNLWIVWSALLISQVIYAALPYFGLLPPPSPDIPSDRAPILYAFAGMGLAELIGQHLAARHIALKAGNILSYFIIRWAIIESVAIYGLVAFPLLGDLRVSLAFAGVALLAMLSLTPAAKQREAFERHLRGEE